MLNFIENYYEVTEQNKDLLRRKIIEEDIRDYNGNKVNLKFFIQVGNVLGNNSDGNHKNTEAYTEHFTIYYVTNTLINVE